MKLLSSNSDKDITLLSATCLFILLKRRKQILVFNHIAKMQMEFDKDDHKDKPERLLAYIYVDGMSVQESLLKEGLARAAFVYMPHTKYIDQFSQDE